MTVSERIHSESGCPCSAGMSTIGPGLEYCSDCNFAVDVECWKIVESETGKEVARAYTKKEILVKYKDLKCSYPKHEILSK